MNASFKDRANNATNSTVIPFIKQSEIGQLLEARLIIRNRSSVVSGIDQLEDASFVISYWSPVGLQFQKQSKQRRRHPLNGDDLNEAIEN